MANIKTKNLINCWDRDSKFSLRLKYYPVHALVKGFKTKNICAAYIGLSGLKLKEKKLKWSSLGRQNGSDGSGRFRVV